MKKNFLKTCQLRVIRKDQDADPMLMVINLADPGVIAQTVIDLDYVTAVAESVGDDGEIDHSDAVLMYGSDEVVIETPYAEVLARWMDKDEPEASAPQAPDLGVAIRTLARALNDDPELYSGWRANLAVAFQDAWNAAPSSTKFAAIGNQAAGNFLDNLIKSVE